MSFLTITNGRIQTDSSSQLGLGDFLQMGELGKKKGGLFSKWKKAHLKVASFVNPVFIHKRHIEMIKKKLAKRKGKKKGGGDQMTDQPTGEIPGEIVPAALQPPSTNPFSTTPGPMSPETVPMAPFYPSPMQPPAGYGSPQFPQAYPGGGGGQSYQDQPYYDQGRDSMPQFINTEEESEWQPPTPMYQGPSAYENDPGQRGMRVQQSQVSPFDTGESEFASGADPGDNFPDGSGMSGWLTTGGGSWEDSGMSDAQADATVRSLRMQAMALRAQGQEAAAQALESEAHQIEAAFGGTNWLLWGGLAIGAWLLFGKKR